MYTPGVLDDPDFPDRARTLFIRLYNQPLISTKVFLRRLEVQLERIRKAAAESEIVDLDLAEKVAASLSVLLKIREREMPWEHKLLIQAATRYYLMEEDLEDDLTSLIGFDDDAGVLNSVCHYLGRPDLVVEVF